MSLSRAELKRCTYEGLLARRASLVADIDEQLAELAAEIGIEAAKPTARVAKGGKKAKRTLSPESRARIATAQTARWKAFHDKKLTNGAALAEPAQEAQA